MRNWGTRSLSLLLLAAPMLAQETRSMIYGRVLEPYLAPRAGCWITVPRRACPYGEIGTASSQYLNYTFPTLADRRGDFSRLLNVDASHIQGRHSLRAGIDFRQHFLTGGGGGNTSGNFSFSNSYTRRNDDSFTPACNFGHDWAAFMMGIPSGMSVATNDSYAQHTP